MTKVDINLVRRQEAHKPPRRKSTKRRERVRIPNPAVEEAARMKRVRRGLRNLRNLGRAS